ncbi:MAG: biotin-dependent carboxyltransferase family protein [Gemmataceae bacterium]|nr:biotin-dependent carboxyltransferase family protein [Gemmataceae bacterium]
MLTIVDSGLATLVVDRGRTQSRSRGLAVGGPADRAAWMLGNALVGNPPDTPALEITLTGPTLRCDVAIGCIVFGAPFALRSDRQQLIVGKTFNLAPGEELRIGSTLCLARAYLCVRGGLTLGNQIPREQIPGNRLPRGAILNTGAARVPIRFLPPDCPFLTRYTTKRPVLRGLPTWSLCVVPGSQADWFPAGLLDERTFTVSPRSDRMGLRLDSDGPMPVPRQELLSEPVCPGTVQVTKDGQCIILGVDAQTIGGYPKIAQVIRSDLDLLGQMRPGEAVRFEMIDLATAQELNRRHDEMLMEWVTRCRATFREPT